MYDMYHCIIASIRAMILDEWEIQLCFHDLVSSHIPCCNEALLDFRCHNLHSAKRASGDLRYPAMQSNVGQTNLREIQTKHDLTLHDL